MCFNAFQEKEKEFSSTKLSVEHFVNSDISLMSIFIATFGLR
jgi:hypothetical protein